MPPLKPGYIVSKTGQVRPAVSSSSANIRENRIPSPPLPNANTREGGTGTDRTIVPGVGTIKTPIGGGTNSKVTNVAKTNFDQETIPSGGDTYVSPMPLPPSPTPPTAKDLGVVKNPSRDVTDIASLVPQADEGVVARILFEQFSAVELAQILTPRTVDGIEQQYSVISNLSDIRRRYNSTKQLTIMDKLAPISGVFGIDINSKIPGDSYIENNNLTDTYSYLDENDSEVTVEKGYIYIDSNGDLIVEFNNMNDDELIQIQIDANGTIYEVTN